MTTVILEAACLIGTIITRCCSNARCRSSACLEGGKTVYRRVTRQRGEHKTKLKLRGRDFFIATSPRHHPLAWDLPADMASLGAITIEEVSYTVRTHARLSTSN